MRSYCRVVLTSLTLFLVCPFSWGFSISGLTPTVTLGQVEQLTWFRDPNDPAVFQLAKGSGTKLPDFNWKTIGPIISVDQDTTQGIVSVNFDDALSQVTIVAYETLFKAEIPKLPGFFTDPNPITIMMTPPPPPPASQNTVLVSLSRTVDSTTTPPPSLSTIPSSHSSTVGNSSPMITSTAVGSNTNELPTFAAVLPDSSLASVADTESETGQLLTVTAAGTTSAPHGGNKNPISPSSPSDALQSHPNVGVIVGATIGSILFVIMLFLLVVCARRRNLQKRYRSALSGRFYRDKMIKSEERLPIPEDQPDFNPFDPFNEPKNVFPASRNLKNVTSPSPDVTHLQVPHHATYTVTETGSAYESYEGGSEYASTVDHTDPYCGIAPRTERQMDIERKIFQLQEQLIRLRGESRSTASTPSISSTVGDIRERIERLKVLQEGQWARELSDEVPMEMGNY
ncbi:hypothetical protein E1B28_013047 [Marasmius oreades]|uniref:Uncharacterized protein n=1 Tax=Marasmius oreades TaxID=181124 RepID=A0A9P7UPH7_9AGAR|nr:uncharacterized protein E1B28_013047 [Marasmius oreades]KAG7087064.1 hypothetical protein E1B28_013047 [Marasmius oreades]